MCVAVVTWSCCFLHGCKVVELCMGSCMLMVAKGAMAAGGKASKWGVVDVIARAMRPCWGHAHASWVPRDREEKGPACCWARWRGEEV